MHPSCPGYELSDWIVSAISLTNLFLFGINPLVLRRRRPRKSEFDREVSKVWPRIDPTKNQVPVLPNDSS
jgi:hypothetical protein